MKRPVVILRGYLVYQLRALHVVYRIDVLRRILWAVPAAVPVPVLNKPQHQRHRLALDDIIRQFPADGLPEAPTLQRPPLQQRVRVHALSALPAFPQRQQQAVRALQHRVSAARREEVVGQPRRLGAAVGTAAAAESGRGRTCTGARRRRAAIMQIHCCIYN